LESQTGVGFLVKKMPQSYDMSMTPLCPRLDTFWQSGKSARKLEKARESQEKRAKFQIFIFLVSSQLHFSIYSHKLAHP
jgi:hypothetical protein